MAAITPGGDDDASSSAEVDPAALHHAAARLSDLSQSLQKRSEVLQREFETLIDYWIGRSADKWGPEFRDWHDQAQKLSVQLEVMSHVVADALQTHLGTDDDNASDLGQDDGQYGA